MGVIRTLFHYVPCGGALDCNGSKARAVNSMYLQGDYVGFNIGNGEKLSYNEATDLAWLCLAVA